MERLLVDNKRFRVQKKDQNAVNGLVHLFLAILSFSCNSSPYFNSYNAKKVFLSKGFRLGQTNAFEFVLSLAKQLVGTSFSMMMLLIMHELSQQTLTRYVSQFCLTSRNADLGHAKNKRPAFLNHNR